MNRKLNISGFQFFCMIFMFGVSASPPVEIFAKAKQDGWISLLIGLIAACLIFAVYIKLYSLFPDLPFTKYIQIILGKYVGKILALIYVLYFLYIAARALRDFEDLLTITLYNASSLISIGLIMMLLTMYAISKGLETFARSCEFIFIVIMFLVFLFIGFEIISKLIKIDNLRPVLENGWKPVFKASPISLTIPFGEVLTFTMIMPHLNKQDLAIKVGIPALLFSGLILTLFAVLNTAILGPSVIERTTYPLLTSVSYINIADFIQRLDTFIVVIAVCNAFVKITIYFYCAVSGAADLFNVKKTDQLVYPIGVITVITSLWMASSFLEHHLEGIHLVPYLLHIPLQIIIPISLLLILLFQGKLKNNKDDLNYN
ncbi:endospore germination permease [Bacillus sp. AFS088145]|uniref:GerAB/ArcD/ProY family transporter n=1 Tax=Bacillus sp. AFS088145 TaxID=2033514 RepID=UPI000BF6E933|nr:endospore germination permease [Bacillus sp. AFS088145]PFH91105.1 spore gernimation protein [Bacillus sp. AFS088145]